MIGGEVWERRPLRFGTCSLTRPYREGCLLLNGKGMWGEEGQISSLWETWENAP